MLVDESAGFMMTDSTGFDPKDNTLLFEMAWEVCNQVGGIYTVLKTKAPAMLDRWKENYFLLGPFKNEAAEIEFEPTVPSPVLEKTIFRMQEKGIQCYFGQWLIPGKPKVLLFDYQSRYGKLDEDKYYLWKDNNIEVDGNDWESNDVIAFGFVVSEFLEVLAEEQKNKKIILHCHEWQAAVPILRVKHKNLPISTVFTTHATLLGRYIASHNANFYNELDWIDPDQAARKYNIITRFGIERAAAHSATVFTTISEVTGREATKFLGRKPDHILPNGLNTHKFMALHEFQNLHLKYKERIHEFVMGHFFPSYTFDLDRTIYFFISGRYEYQNKGMDLYIESLWRLNQKLKETANPPTVVAFIVTKADVKNINVNALQRHLMFEDLKNHCNDIEKGVGQRILSAVSRGRMPAYEDILSNDFQVRLKRIIYASRNARLPMIVTHDMNNDGGDPVLRHLRHRGMFNDPSDPVKVVFHPEFVTATSPLINLDYDQFVRGCNLGIFPSYYEPWGYTPLECIALGLPTVTTDLAGFGSYVQSNIADSEEQGIYVLNRSKQSNDSAIGDLADYLYNFTRLSRRERIELRNRAERITERFDWSVLASHYHSAHDHAVRSAYKNA